MASLANRTLPFEHQDVEQAITIAHDDKTLSPRQMGFSTPDAAREHATEDSAASTDSPAPVAEASSDAMQDDGDGGR